jgi:hypothetical protein
VPEALNYSCNHPMIVRREDGGTYCTECGARVA